MKNPVSRLQKWLLAALFLSPVSGVRAETAPLFDKTRLQSLSQVLTDAFTRKEVPGAVVWLERSGRQWVSAYGYRSVDPDQRSMNVDTIFDAASLTKVMATAPAIMLLVEEGKVDLNAPASRYLPEFKGEGKEAITVRQMMTHMSGLKPGLLPGEPWEGYAAGVSRALTQVVGTAPNLEFRYSDLNFILLGEIVRRVSGEPLEAFTKRRLYQPLTMNDTKFKPSPYDRDRIAPTTREGDTVVQGVVHDPTARRMGGVAGHAGLFTNVRDTARFCRMLLEGGRAPDGRVIMKEETVRAMIAVQPLLPGGVRRTMGFDAGSTYSDPKGVHFGPRSFGHTGWTGTCFWIDPDAKAFYILFTNRNHPNEGKSVKNLRWQTATLAAEAMGVAKPVLSGVDLLARQSVKELEGKRIALITNQTGLTSSGATTLSVLQKVPQAKVVRLFSPEHGIAGKLDEDGIPDSMDEASGLPVTSLYGKQRKPSPESLKDVDVLVFDIQDIGTRFYTYISTMLNCMDSAAASKLPFVVLDRVNPLGGRMMDGPLPVDVKNPFVACHSIPIRHGLTTGELAKLFVRERFPELALTVVPVEGWERRFFFSETMAPWVNPSPNMRSPQAALLYPGIGLLEFSNVSVGRGTDQPFTVLGAPWINAEALHRRLEAINLPGLQVEMATFKPNASVFNDEVCQGVRFRVTDPRIFRPVRLGICIAQALYEEHGELYKLDKVNNLLYHPATLKAIREHKPLKDITAAWDADVLAFRARVKDILIYPDTAPQ